MTQMLVAVLAGVAVAAIVVVLVLRTAKAAGSRADPAGHTHRLGRGHFVVVHGTSPWGFFVGVDPTPGRGHQCPRYVRGCSG